MYSRARWCTQSPAVSFIRNPPERHTPRAYPAIVGIPRTDGVESFPSPITQRDLVFAEDQTRIWVEIVTQENFPGVDAGLLPLGQSISVAGRLPPDIGVIERFYFRFQGQVQRDIAVHDSAQLETNVLVHASAPQIPRKVFGIGIGQPHGIVDPCVNSPYQDQLFFLFRIVSPFQWCEVGLGGQWPVSNSTGQQATHRHTEQPYKPDFTDRGDARYRSKCPTLDSMGAIQREEFRAVYDTSTTHHIPVPKGELRALPHRQGVSIWDGLTVPGDCAVPIWLRRCWQTFLKVPSFSQ